MKNRTPHFEFSRPLQVDRVPKLGSTEKLSAEPEELKALAKRFKIPALHALSAEIRATPWRGGGMKLEGHITADMEQVSVISLEPFRETVSVPLARYFLPPPRQGVARISAEKACSAGIFSRAASALSSAGSAASFSVEPALGTRSTCSGRENSMWGVCCFMAVAP